MTKYVTFESDPTLIKRSGDNNGYIYNPTSLIYLGETFSVLSGEAIMIIPLQPDQHGPWKQYRTSFENGRFLRCKDKEVMSIMIENRFPKQVVQITKGNSLAVFLNQWGIKHKMTFVSDPELKKIEAYKEIITLDTASTDENDVESFKIKKHKIKRCPKCYNKPT